MWKQLRNFSGRELAKDSLLLVCSLAFACLLAEGLVRLLLPEWAPRTALIDKFWRYDPRYGWSHIPGVTGLFKSYGIDSVVTINSKGFRGSEVDYACDTSRKRALVLGDSLVWGFGVNSEDMFTSQIERLVPELEVVNLGVSGYSTDQELLLYQDEGRKYQADIVVVVVAYNDNGGNARTVEYLIYGKPAFSLNHKNRELINQPVAKTSWVKRAAVRLAWRSYILTHLHRYLYQVGVGRDATPKRTLQQQSAVVSPPNGVKHEFSEAAAAWEITARLLLEFKQATSQDGVEFLVVFAEGIHVARELAAFLGKFEIDSLVLEEAVDKDDKSLYLPDMVHWSPMGHKVVATVLAERLRQKSSSLGQVAPPYTTVVR